MKRISIAALCIAAILGCDVALADNEGGISAAKLQQLRSGYSDDASTKALRNAIANNDIDKLALSADNKNGFDSHFSHRVKSKGITDQKSSGRCWLFTGLNVIRSQMMADHDLPELELSQAYNFFYDQLEKSNLFLQGIIDYADRPMDDRMVEWLFGHPLSDGGQFTGIADNLSKYGIVPAECMQETFSTNNTSKMNRLISLKLRQDGLELRKMHNDGASSEELLAAKDRMLGDIYRMLALTIGEPPTEFEWTRRNSKGDVVSRKTYTPKLFYDEYVGKDLKNGYVMLMNDPSRPYHKVYEIDYDRHFYDGDNWRYLNLPADEIKEMAIASIKDSTMMYFSCDVAKFLDRERGLMDPANYDYSSLFGVDFSMDKADRIRSQASASSHAMTLCAVDLDDNGKPVKWMVENSWGPGANDGHLIFSDQWFDDYMFRLVVDRKYVPAKTLKLLEQEPVMLPAWDILY